MLESRECGVAACEYECAYACVCACVSEFICVQLCGVVCGVSGSAVVVKKRVVCIVV